jgi:hypothetical protein
VLSWLNRAGPLAVPRFVWVLFAIDAALGAAYLADWAVGHPSETFAHLVDLDGERNLPTWYASTLWFSAAAILFGVADRYATRSSIRSWTLWLLPALYLAFSMDETIQVHEAVGTFSDVLLPGGTRDATVVHVTGVYGLVVGVPFLIAFGLLILSARPYLRRPPGALTKVVIGMVLMMTGAVGFEFLSNFVVEGSLPAILEIYVEESLEMIGATGGVTARVAGPPPRCRSRRRSCRP